jgi:hypothetical protein
MYMLKVACYHQAQALQRYRVKAMAHDLLDETFAPDPKTLKLLSQAFDEVWQDIAGNYDAAIVQDRRHRLAEVILRLVRDNERDLNEIRREALDIMRHKEQHSRH